MTSEQKIAYVEKQIDNAKLARRVGIEPYGGIDIKCPYCDGSNVQGNPICCEKLATLVAAILVRKDDQARRETMERIMEKVQSN